MLTRSPGRKAASVVCSSVAGMTATQKLLAPSSAIVSDTPVHGD